MAYNLSHHWSLDGNILIGLYNSTGTVIPGMNIEPVTVIVVAVLYSKNNLNNFKSFQIISFQLQHVTICAFNLPWSLDITPVPY